MSGENLNESRVILEKVTIADFRSWAAGAFNFTDGVTLVTGKNGTGKSTIGMSVQYAVSGKLPKLAKDDLKRIGAPQGSRVRVSLHLKIGDEAVVLTRTNGKAALKVGTEAVSVREAEYLDDLKQSIEYSFLSQNAAAFVDMPEFKRREVLDGLIPEVQLLRAGCHPELKKILKHYNEKRQSVAANIVSVAATVSEHEGILYSARKNYDEAIARQQAIVAAQQAKLPYSEQEYAALVARHAELITIIANLETYLNSARKWLEYAQTEESTQRSYATSLSQKKDNLRSVRDHHAYLVQQRDSTDSVVCQKCKQPLECKHCGHAAVNPNDTPGIVSQIEGLAQRIAAITQDIEATEKYLAEAAPVDGETLKTTREGYNKAQNDLAVLRPELTTVQQNITRYDMVSSSIQAAMSAADDSASIAAFKQHCEDIAARMERLQVLLKRKEKLHGVMLALENDLRTAADVVHSTLPLIYFDTFLQNLARACNFLLSAISSMTVSMCTTEDGILIAVSGKKLAQLSSGEMQRVRVAVTLAFSLMAVKTDTLFLDEVFDAALDHDGVTALATLLHGSVSKFYKKIVVITHNEALMVALQPTTVVTMTKDGQGNSVCNVQDGQKLAIFGG